MKLHEIIRQKRIAKNLTQEQVASRLGITASAVNKWEKEISYPDITLLPALARLLETDLNTLLSFKEDLSWQEIGDFTQQIVTDAAEYGITHAFEMTMDKIHEYPSCYSLHLNAALTLEGVLMMHPEEDGSSIVDAIEELYERVAECDDTAIRTQAQSMLINKYLGREDYEKAEALIKKLPNPLAIDTQQIKANFAFSKGNFELAGQLITEKLLSNVVSVQSELFFLLDILLKDNQMQKATQLSDIIRQMVPLFGLWNYSSYIPDLEMAVLKQDATACLSILDSMLTALQQKWDIHQSPLFYYLPVKETKENFGELMLPRVLYDLQNPTETKFDFLQKHPDFQNLLQRFQ